VARWPWFRELLANVGGRTCYFDDQIRRAVQEGVDQIVILGAGYDSRSLRLAVEGVRFFEVDLPSTQEEKVACLTSEGLRSPATLVPMDLCKDSLRERLGRAGFSVDRPAFFLWEGVLEYLPESVGRETLRSIRGLAARGSVLCLDPIHESSSDRPALLRWLGRVAARVVGEPRHFRLSPDCLGVFLASADWNLEETVEIADLHERYLKGISASPRFHHNYAARASIG
jgi:methyltransferase (TIGR00027 family)